MTTTVIANSNINFSIIHKQYIFRDHFVESEDYDIEDRELLFSIPFSSEIKLRAITIIGEENDVSSEPSNVLLYKNREEVCLLFILP